MENQRVRLSKMLLKNALITLLKEKPLEKITIYELCAKAQLNRVTFYKYYGSQSDLLTDIENDCFRKLEEILSDNASDGEDCLCRMLEALLADEEHFKVLINALPDKDFQPSCSICPLSGASLTWRSRTPLPRKNGMSFAFSSIRAAMR